MSYTVVLLWQDYSFFFSWGNSELTQKAADSFEGDEKES
jgi:hypothetical protein